MILQSDAIAQFRDAMQAAGLSVPETVTADGVLHRFSSNGKRGDDSGWYVLHGDGVPAGSFGCWRSGLAETWSANIGRELTDEERRANRARMELLKRERQQEQVKRHVAAAKRAAEIWNAAEVAASHQYLIKKQVNAYGLRLHEDLLVIPMRDADRRLSSLQFIRLAGDKRFLTGGKVTGCYHTIGEPVDLLCIVEGYATGATIHQVTGQAVAIAFNAGNLQPVALALRRKYRNLRLLICADNDHKTEGNPGVTKAQEAAKAANALVAVPEFEGDGTDFNDMCRLHGADVVKAALRQVLRKRAA